MDSSFSAYVIAGISCLIPIVMWGYLASTLQERPEGFATRKFGTGLLVGAVSVLPILTFDLLRTKFQDGAGIFGFFASGWMDVNARLDIPGISMDLAVPLIAVVIAATVCTFILRWRESGKFFRAFFRISLPHFLMASVSLIIVVALLWLVGMGGRATTVDVRIQWVVIANILWLVSYYFLVGYIEESSKHAHSLIQREEGMDAKAFVLVSLFTTLGFAFLENALYLSNILLAKDGGFFSTLTTRSLMSVAVHGFTAAIFASAFGKAMNGKNTPHTGSFKKSVIVGMALSIVAHAVFDIGATYGNGAVILTYLWFAYVYVTRIFAVDSEGSSEYRTAS